MNNECMRCGKPATLVNHTQFAGTHYWCEEHVPPNNCESVMKLNELQKAYDDRFDLITRLLQYIKYAESNHLDVEFMDSFLQEYLVDQNIGMSIRHAAREWDL